MDFDLFDFVSVGVKGGGVVCGGGFLYSLSPNLIASSLFDSSFRNSMSCCGLLLNLFLILAGSSANVLFAWITRLRDS